MLWKIDKHSSPSRLPPASRRRQVHVPLVRAVTLEVSHWVILALKLMDSWKASPTSTTKRRGEKWPERYSAPPMQKSGEGVRNDGPWGPWFGVTGHKNQTAFSLSNSTHFAMKVGLRTAVKGDHARGVPTTNIGVEARGIPESWYHKQKERKCQC